MQKNKTENVVKKSKEQKVKKKRVLLVGLDYSGLPFDNVVIETRGFCKANICKENAADPLYEYDIIIIHPKSYSHYIFGKETEHSDSSKELWDLKREDNLYDIDTIFDIGDRKAELNGAIKRGTRVIWVAAKEKQILFFRQRYLHDGYLNDVVKDVLSNIYEKSSYKISLSANSKAFLHYFEQLKIDGWKICWHSYNQGHVIFAKTPEEYWLGCEILIEDNKGWILTPPTSESAIEALIRCALELKPEDVNGTDIKYHGIFLSYSHEDKEFVKKLKVLLNEKGVDKVWIDESEIMVGDSLIDKIHEGIEKTEYFGVVLSPHSVESNWVKKELETAMNLEIKSQKVKILPLLYRDCNLPLFINNKMYADFRQTDQYDESIRKLLERLEKK